MVMEAASSESKWGLWKPDVFGPLFDRRGTNPPPSRELATILVQGKNLCLGICFMILLTFIFHDRLLSKL